MKNINEIPLLLILMSVGYTINFALGIAGSTFSPESFWQMTCWQMGDAAAIMASVLASRYIGTKGFHIVPAGFTLLGIAYGVSFASSAFNAINEDKMATIILPLLPALLLISIGKFFPVWVRFLSAVTCIPFFFIYLSVIKGTYSFENISNVLAYSGIQLLGVIWSIYMFLNFKSTSSASNPIVKN
ncbi:MAG: hypothetical protein IPO78_06360 [Saprospiraceae bacterium]|nr:hypothetical protein [Saprospiraceae bacterium]MBK9221837.1 hypothetical protein [Saprospiraceae bacterium]MBK9721226.1 hypothetical protein [Saprospiraceae bacterium]MBK9728222.1 hypothetical protein [Saprospiraceae bacterium]